MKVTVVSDRGSKDSRDAKFVGTIKGRPWGQCTWEVATVRLSQKPSIPPGAFDTNIKIKDNPSYAPMRWDAFVFGNKAHVGIISSLPIKKEEKIEGGTKITYEFEVQDRNALWDEEMKRTIHGFEIIIDSRGTKRIISNFSRAGEAIGCYR